MVRIQGRGTGNALEAQSDGAALSVPSKAQKGYWEISSPGQDGAGTGTELGWAGVEAYQHAIPPHLIRNPLGPRN